MADLSKTPLVALSIDTKTLLSTLLNPTKWLPTDDGLPRDWRGLAHLWEISGEMLPSLASHCDPTGQLLTFVQNKKPACTLKDFEFALGKIDRWDAIDDTRSLIVRDAEQYTERMERCKNSTTQIHVEVENKILTIDDMYRIKQGMENQCYDAFVLYADEDIDFVKEMISVLEIKHRLKLCLKDRDLMGGIQFEHEAMMQLISERCNRLIVVISPDFIKSSANTFFLNFAQAVGIGTGQRKIIPCLYKKCELPAQLAYQFILDYGKKGLYDFWERLYACVQIISQENSSMSPPPVQALSERLNENCKNTEIPKSLRNGTANSAVNIESLEKKDNPVRSILTNNKPAKVNKMKKLMIWGKKNVEKKCTEC